MTENNVTISNHKTCSIINENTLSQVFDKLKENDDETLKGMMRHYDNRFNFSFVILMFLSGGSLFYGEYIPFLFCFITLGLFVAWMDLEQKVCRFLVLRSNQFRSYALRLLNQ